MHDVKCLGELFVGIVPDAADLAEPDGHGPVVVWKQDVVEVQDCWSEDEGPCGGYQPLVAAKGERLDQLLPCPLMEPLNPRKLGE